MGPPQLSFKHRLAARLQRSWTQRDWLSLALLDVSYLYRAAVALRRWTYEQGLAEWEKMPVPVIVVGNVVAGGAGKTPVVIEIARDLLARGWQPGVVSRGYGRSVNGGSLDVLEVTSSTPVAASGDEPALIKYALDSDVSAPVFVANQRAGAAKALLAAYPQTNVIVCDDGLQHLALPRDVEVCVFDARGVGNGRLLPAGPLREPWPRKPYHSQTCKPPSQWVLHTAGAPAGGNDARTGFTAFAIQRRLASYALRADGSQVPLTELQAKPLTALAAIAQPEAFFAMLRELGLNITETIPLSDHYNFDSWSRTIHAGNTLICTEKDAVKLWQHAPGALAMPLQVNIDPAFFTALHEKLSSLSAKP